jgi:hypothetical protein
MGNFYDITDYSADVGEPKSCYGGKEVGEGPARLARCSSMIEPIDIPMTYRL